jgi:Na+-translocating ferredoxin:NAD+ oxidoreductase subunit B
MPDRDPTLSRRDVLSKSARAAGLLAAGGALATLLARAEDNTVWQIDPFKCVQCGKCATSCVLNPSAVKCLNVFPMCGYCNKCTGYLEAWVDNTREAEAGENHLCPTGALKRKWIEKQYYEYTVDAASCIGCSRCVKGCLELGNGSLFLQIDQTICVRCNQCSIATACPSQAISRVPISKPYILVDKTRNG